MMQFPLHIKALDDLICTLAGPFLEVFRGIRLTFCRKHLGGSHDC